MTIKRFILLCFLLLGISCTGQSNNDRDSIRLENISIDISPYGYHLDLYMRKHSRTFTTRIKIEMSNNGPMNIFSGYQFTKNTEVEDGFFITDENRNALFAGLAKTFKCNNFRIAFELPVGIYWINYKDQDVFMRYGPSSIPDVGVYLSPSMLVYHKITDDLEVGVFMTAGTLKILDYGITFKYKL